MILCSTAHRDDELILFKKLKNGLKNEARLLCLRRIKIVSLS